MNTEVRNSGLEARHWRKRMWVFYYPICFSIYFGKGDSLIAAFEVKDALKENSKEAVRQLESYGVEVCMLTGDKESAASEIARQAGITHYEWGVLPDDKERFCLGFATSGQMCGYGRRWH